MIREFRALRRQTAADQPLAPGALGDRPLIVLTRGAGSRIPVHRSWQAWRDLHQDRAQLSANHRHLMAESPGHYIHCDDPALVTAAIRDALRTARTNTPLEPEAAT